MLTVDKDQEDFEQAEAVQIKICEAVNIIMSAHKISENKVQ